MHKILPFRVRTSTFEVLTPNEKDSLIKRERERRRLIRFKQVRQQANENELKIRAKVKVEKQKEVELLEQELANAIAHKQCISRVLSPTKRNVTKQLISPLYHRRKLTEEETRKISDRYRHALLNLKRHREERRAKVTRANELRKRAIYEANLRSKRIT